ncbi:protein-L-isoaspartate O-methyltransferase family protein [Microbacterium sp.]|uniref:protein-L-isoaspartate O-methyltransferase family protein n=1 Tax=Microbacterium sp. TaxID=51671 RepID=UPI0028121208|nr:protein-L-isoaspartate O-methyltransferase [Microbacterium sp.]
MAGIHVAPETVARVRAAMHAASRPLFLPREVRHLAGADRPVMIGWDATNSQPSTVERMLQLLKVHDGARVLDVGSGSGWTTAILAVLAGPEGTVIGVEIVPELVRFGRERLAEAWSVALADAGAPRPEIRQATAGARGLPDEAPFDRILVSAAATSLPSELAAQLAEGGRMVVPVAGVMTVVDRRGENLRVRRDDGLYSFVPLQE